MPDRDSQATPAGRVITWPPWLRWVERLILVQAFCSIIPGHVLGRPEVGYRYWMYVSLVLVVGVTLRRIISLARRRPPPESRFLDRGPGPTNLD